MFAIFTKQNKKQMLHGNNNNKMSFTCFRFNLFVLGISHFLQAPIMERCISGYSTSSVEVLSIMGNMHSRPKIHRHKLYYYTGLRWVVVFVEFSFAFIPTKRTNNTKKRKMCHTLSTIFVRINSKNHWTISLNIELDFANVISTMLLFASTINRTTVYHRKSIKLRVSRTHTHTHTHKALAVLTEFPYTISVEFFFLQSLLMHRHLF